MAGKGEEQIEAARALSLLCIQLGLTDEGEAMFATIRPTLQNLVIDPTASPVGKTGVSLSMICWLCYMHSLASKAKLCDSCHSLWNDFMLF